MKQVIALLVGLLGMTMAFDAAAWAHRKTDSGQIVRWEKREVIVSLDPSLGLLGNMDDIEDMVTEKLDLWIEEADLPTDFVVVRQACGDPGYRKNGGNFNCLLADETFGREGENVGATTMLTFKGESGSLVDSDIVFNAQQWRWSVGGEVAEPAQGHGENPSSGNDDEESGNESAPVLSFDVVLTHELGHLLGMAHSEVDEAIMFPTTKTGAVVDVALAEDDVDGVVALYEGLEEVLEAQEGGPSGCQAVPGRSASGSGGLALLLLGLLFSVRRLAPQSIRRERR
ncbi:MAG: matrixin family metalloprotease [Myxococcota bacterium]|jgi:MYXO-CTERM domain-containing protein|nr:matrixin family metalloprotease [Myxococcota bacterium]